MDDESLNRELDAALNVDPSREFLARTRARLAGEPKPSRWCLTFDTLAWGRAWAAVPVVAVAVVLLAVIGVMKENKAAPAVPVQAVARVVAPKAQTAPIIQRAEIPSPRDNTSPRGGRLQAARTVQRVARSLPEVIVSADEQRALEFVAQIAFAGRVSDLSVAPAATAIEPVTLRDVEIMSMGGLTPLHIEPLRITRLETGEIQ